MFFKAKNLEKTLDLSKWDVRNCTDFAQMFGSSSVVDSNIGKWNLHTDASVVGMFSGTKFKGDLSSWSKKHQAEAKTEPKPEVDPSQGAPSLCKRSKRSKKSKPPRGSR